MVEMAHEQVTGQAGRQPGFCHARMVFFFARRDGFETFHDLPSSKKVSTALLQTRRDIKLTTCADDESLVCINRVVRSFGIELSSSEAQVVL
jgi:hypothetical protein